MSDIHKAIEAVWKIESTRLLSSVRGDLLVKLGRYAEARDELQRAMTMTDNRREHEVLSKKLKQAMFIN
jgi:RNA polymerase sigma-70 factor, ECF subfamily